MEYILYVMSVIKLGQVAYFFVLQLQDPLRVSYYRYVHVNPIMIFNFLGLCLAIGAGMPATVITYIIFSIVDYKSYTVSRKEMDDY